MPARKPRILMVNEASYLSTGYSTYGMEVQRRLHESGLFEVAELACYDDRTAPGRSSIPWKLYANTPENEAEASQYMIGSPHEFGEFKFGRTCLDFRPDIVWDVRDPWMTEHVGRSPYRRLFHWCLMPTVDSAPQQEQWISTFADADRLLAYTDWGADVLREQGGGLIDVRGTASPGADLDTFRPMDRAEVRRQMGVEDDVLIVGTVMRNQPRKYYPNLIRAFRLYLDGVDATTAKRSFLYLHTSYPDLGWDIPGLIKESGISHKILVTYKCRACKLVSPCFYQDAVACCERCGQMQSRMPNVHEGLERAELATVINLFDAYVQYANAEGFGLPLVEAASCGVPVFATDYSAMSDVVRKINGFPIRVLHMQRDPEVNADRAIPDDRDLAAQLAAFFGLSPEGRAVLGRAARAGVEAHYTWDKAAQVWTDTFLSLPLRDEKDTWLSPPHIHRPVKPPEWFPTYEECVRWCITNYLGRPDLARSYMALRLIRDLNWGSRVESLGGTYQNEDSTKGNRLRMRPFGTGDMLLEFDQMLAIYNEAEAIREHHTQA